MKKIRNVVSLFDGMSCGQIALNKEGIYYDNYYASEITKGPKAVTQANYPKTIQVGDVNNWREWSIDWSRVDLLLAGSPCQGFSRAGNGLNFEHPQSKLFFVFIEILDHVKKYNPNVKFLLENVSMKKEWLELISEYVGIKPININSKLVSIASRNRFYWTNIDNIEKPKELELSLKDFLEKDSKDFIYLKEEKVKELEELGIIKYIENKNILRVKEATKKGYTDIKNLEGVDLTFPKSKTRRGRNMGKKINCITKTRNNYFIYQDQKLRYLTQRELELCQTVPLGYTNILNINQANDVLGNGWTVDIIRHIFKNL